MSTMESSSSLAASNNNSHSNNSHAVANSSSNSPSSTSGFHKTSSSKIEDNDAGVIAAPSASFTMEEGGPAEIPPEPIGKSHEDEGDEEEQPTTTATAAAEEDDESEYEYEDDDDAAFSGFLVDHAPLAVAQQASATVESSSFRVGGGSSVDKEEGDEESPARIRDDEESLQQQQQEQQKQPQTKKWREPSRDAVNMSLRAEREKTGSKRRLAQDLYRIMNQDTEEAGFSIQPKSEDNMDHWTIKLFKFDNDSNLAKDMVVLGFEHIELEMAFPDQYPFEPPFVRVVRPRFKRQTGFVMNGALCMELLTKEGWNPVNDIESVIVSIRSLLVVGDGRLQAAHEMSEAKYQARLKAAAKEDGQDKKRLKKTDDAAEVAEAAAAPSAKPAVKEDVGSYSMAEAQAAYSHLSDYHKKKGWDSSGWWARKG